MKYIRTKEGKIIDIDKRYQWHLENGWINKRIKDKETFIKISHHNIVAQADTIEELCDEFLIKGTRGIYLGIPLQECELRNIPITQIYGAIWTDKGLMYVAKMNDKGELELL